MLADKMVELDIVDSVSHETIRQTLKKNELKPWPDKGGICSGEIHHSFFCHGLSSFFLTSV